MVLFLLGCPTLLLKIGLVKNFTKILGVDFTFLVLNNAKNSGTYNEIEKICSNTGITCIKVRKQLSKHPNFWYIIRAPKPSAGLYNKYLKVREFNIYDDANVLNTVDRTDIVRALLLLMLQDIVTKDTSLSVKRLLLYLQNEYSVEVDKKIYDHIMLDAKMLADKIKENNLGKLVK